MFRFTFILLILSTISSYGIDPKCTEESGKLVFQNGTTIEGREFAQTPAGEGGPGALELGPGTNVKPGEFRQRTNEEVSAEMATIQARVEVAALERARLRTGLGQEPLIPRWYGNVHSNFRDAVRNKRINAFEDVLENRSIQRMVESMVRNNELSANDFPAEMNHTEIGQWVTARYASALLKRADHVRRTANPPGEGQSSDMFQAMRRNWNHRAGKEFTDPQGRTFEEVVDIIVSEGAGYQQAARLYNDHQAGIGSRSPWLRELSRGGLTNLQINGREYVGQWAGVRGRDFAMYERPSGFETNVANAAKRAIAEKHEISPELIDYVFEKFELNEHFRFQMVLRVAETGDFRNFGSR